MMAHHPTSILYCFVLFVYHLGQTWSSLKSSLDAAGSDKDYPTKIITSILCAFFAISVKWTVFMCAALSVTGWVFFGLVR